MTDFITYCDVIQNCEDCPRYGDDCDGSPERLYTHKEAWGMTDLIRREDAIAYIERVINSGLGRSKSLDYIHKYISALPSADAVSREFYEDAVKANHGLAKENSELKAQLESADAVHGWIPCSERLPKSGRYLASCLSPVFSPQVLNYDEDDGKWFYDGCKSIDFELLTVIAWMPLPPSYRGE